MPYETSTSREYGSFVVRLAESSRPRLTTALRARAGPTLDRANLTPIRVVFRVPGSRVQGHIAAELVAEPAGEARAAGDAAEAVLSGGGRARRGESRPVAAEGEASSKGSAAGGGGLGRRTDVLGWLPEGDRSPNVNQINDGRNGSFFTWLVTS